jgi:hypothetical protein
VPAPKRILIERAGGANAVAFSFVRTGLERPTIEALTRPSAAIRATGCTVGNYVLHKQSGGNSFVIGSGRVDLVVDAAKQRAVATARELFADRFVGARVEADPSDETGHGYTVWIEVRQPDAVAEEVAMEKSFYSKIERTGDDRVHALLEFRTA